MLTPQAVQALFQTLRQLASEGCSILYISHKLDEIRELCHRCTVMRGGRVTGVCDPRQETDASLSRLMIGSEPPSVRHDDRPAGRVVFSIKGLTLPRAHPFATPLDNISFDMHEGEILGVAGVSGNGQQELLAALAGEDRRVARDALLFDGRAVGHTSASWRRARGLGFVPEERLGRGAVPDLSLAQNMLLSHQNPQTVKRGFIRRPVLRSLASGIIDQFRVKAHGPQAAAASLSGGNLQKYIIGREVTRRPRVLLVAQPTWGVDVGAAAQIRAELLALRDAGCAVLLISEELDELFEISDRLTVMAKGRMSPALPTGEASLDLVGRWMSGLWQTEARDAEA